MVCVCACSYMHVAGFLFVHCTFKFLMIGCSGLISKTLLPLMKSKLEVSPAACAFISLQGNQWDLDRVRNLPKGSYLEKKWEEIYLSMLADQPNLPDTRTQGEELRRLEIWTLATLSPKCFLIQSQVWPNSCFISLSFSSFLSPAQISNHVSLNWPKWKPKILPFSYGTINSFHIS